MTTKDENYLSMGRTVDDVFTRYQSVWETNPRITREITEFRNTIEMLSGSKDKSNIVTTGATVDKEEAALALFNQAMNLGKRGSVYALDINNMELHDRLRVSKGYLTHLHDDAALSKSRDIYDQLLPLKDKLGEYGITEAELGNLKKHIDSFGALINRPRDLVVERQGHNDNIPPLMASLRKSIYKLDSLMNLFEDTPFETDYKNARKVINTGYRKDKKNDAGSPK